MTQKARYLTTTDSLIAATPKPPYCAVIFICLLIENIQRYVEAADEKVALAGQQVGFLGFESARNTLGITVFFWPDLASI